MSEFLSRKARKTASIKKINVYKLRRKLRSPQSISALLRKQTFQTNPKSIDVIHLPNQSLRQNIHILVNQRDPNSKPILTLLPHIFVYQCDPPPNFRPQILSSMKLPISHKIQGKIPPIIQSYQSNLTSYGQATP